MTSSPAAAPYAAALAEVLPVEAQTIARAPDLHGLGHGHDHAPVLERTGRVLALDLEVEVRHTDGGTEPLRADERRRALAEGQAAASPR